MTLSVSVRGSILVAIGLLLVPFITLANTDCSFTRTLSLGDDGSDVKCLQQYLNANGFLVAETGVGSPGFETTTYGSLTEAAVLRWQQANSIAGANGNFGPASRTAYQALEVSDTVPADAGVLTNLVADLEAQLAAGLATAGTDPTPQVAGVSDSVTRAAWENTAADLERTIRVLQDIHDYTDDLDDEDDEADVRAELAPLLDDVFDLLIRQFVGDFSAVKDDVTDVRDSLVDFRDDEFEDEQRDEEDDEREAEQEEVEEFLEDIADFLDAVEAEIEDAEDDGEDVDEAEDLLEEADDALDDARNAYGLRAFDRSLDLAENAEELLEEALDEIDSTVTGGNDEDEAEEALEDAFEKLDELEEEIEDAEEDDEDIDEAQELFEEAEELLEEAEDELDDEDFDEVLDLVEEAEELIEEAEDEL